MGFETYHLYGKVNHVNSSTPKTITKLLNTNSFFAPNGHECIFHPQKVIVKRDSYEIAIYFKPKQGEISKGSLTDKYFPSKELEELSQKGSTLKSKRDLEEMVQDTLNLVSMISKNLVCTLEISKEGDRYTLKEGLSSKI